MKHPIRTIIFSVYWLIAVVVALKIFNVIHLSWLILSSPFLIGLFIFVVYIITLLIWSYVHRKREINFINSHEKSFLCHKCGKPLKEGVYHKPEESVYHKHCTPKN